MHSTWFTLASALWGLLGLVLLINSISALIRIHTSGPRVEKAALSPSFQFDLAKEGTYEIAVKRSTLFGAIPRNNSFRIDDLTNHRLVTVLNYSFLTTKRTDVSGNRIVPVAEFSINQPGTFQLTNQTQDNFTDTDQLLITPKSTGKTVITILAILFSAFVFLSGFVLFILSLIKPSPA